MVESSKDKYVRDLEEVIRRMIKPLRNIPLNLVIEALSDHRIIPFDPADKRDARLLEDLRKVAQSAGERVNREGILSRRPNEVGNYIEPVVKDALNRRGLQADTPRSSVGKKKATGYPDLVFTDRDGRPNYLECKTFNVKNADTTQRAFYLSPSKDSKITADAHHLVLSYQMIPAGRRQGKTVYHCQRYKLLSIEDLRVDVKYEFNSDNRRLYGEARLLAEEELHD